jgi:hypothetical protein
LGELELKEEEKIIVNTNYREVNNTFSAPAATGCGGPFAPIVDRLIDSAIGLPSPSGYNTVVHEGYVFGSPAPSVIAHEH